MQRARGPTLVGLIILGLLGAFLVVPIGMVFVAAFSDAQGQVGHHGNALVVQVLGWPHAREHQELRRMDGPRTQQDLAAGCCPLHRPVGCAF